ncbi:MAG: PilZ domain-containing protein [Pseudomonadales bacterium]|nr:PilZ domain-containing protein [Pseudomonadales bacterium]
MQGGNKGILAINIQDAAQLYAQYMPFVDNGGLFIPTKKQYNMGDEVFMLITLFDEPEKMPVAGKIVWITPQGAEGNRQSGIGVKFNGADEVAKNKIETLLTGTLNSDRPTHTM